jgi:hypothetical protein
MFSTSPGSSLSMKELVEKVKLAKKELKIVAAQQAVIVITSTQAKCLQNLLSVVCLGMVYDMGQMKAGDQLANLKDFYFGSTVRTELLGQMLQMQTGMGMYR